MAKISKNDFLNNIQNIINEGFTPDAKVDYLSKFNISNYVNGLFESGQRNPKLMTYLNNYNNLLKNSETKEFMVFEQFGQGLAQYATGNKEVKNVIAKMNETLAEYGGELKAHCLIECIQDPVAKEAVECAYENYLNDENELSRCILMDAIDACAEEGDPVAPQLTIVITTDAAERLPQIELGTSESKFDAIQQKIKEEKQRKQMEAVKAEIDAYARKVFDDAEEAKRAEKEACCFENIINNNGINLRESIKAIASSDARSNKKLMETIDQYAGALNQGLYEERLYESFVKNISKYNYLNVVDKEINRINEAVREHASSVMVTRILEEMSATPSYYIIPLIEEDAARYVKNPSDINRVQLRNVLCQFISDPYCNAMLETIEHDCTNSAVATLEEKALTKQDQIKVMRQNANVCNIYSPVQYIKENECVFNANGQFYVKKGNTLAKLSNEYLNQLSENFIALCQLVNDPRVSILDESIALFGSDKVATIYEGYVEINGNKETTDTLRNLNEMCMKYDYDTNFFVMASCLHEHFNDIAVINFGKHIELNENAGVSVDMFRCGNNIFINCVNEAVDKSTFYHNVNPIQCRNIINKHMGINVATLFEDLIPSQEKILLKLNETKNEYETSIEKYEAAIEKLQKAKEECNFDDNEAKIDDALESAKKKLEDLKSEYKDWQDEVANATEAPEDEIEDTDVEKSAEPIDAEDVEAAKPELMQPLRSQDADFNEEDPMITDDEFDTYLSDEDIHPVEGASEVADMEDTGDNTEVSMMHHALEGDGRENKNPDEFELVEPIEDEETDNEEPIEDEAEDAFVEIKVDDDSIEAEDNTESEEEVEEPVEDAEFNDIEEDTEEDVVVVPDGYQISNIKFDQNIKTGELFKTGTVSVVCPMVDADGNMYVNSKDYNFYIDEESHLPICDAADVPVALYQAIIASIQADPTFVKADSEGVVDEKEEGEGMPTYFDAEDIKDDSEEMEAEDDTAFFDFSEDKDGNITISAKEEEETPEEAVSAEVAKEHKAPTMKEVFGVSDDEDIEDEDDEEDNEQEIIAPTYKDGETEIELPAANVDGSDIPEVSAEEAEAVEDAVENDEDDEEIIVNVFNDDNTLDSENDEDEISDDNDLEEDDTDLEEDAELEDEEIEFPDYDEVEVEEENQDVIDDEDNDEEDIEAVLADARHAIDKVAAKLNKKPITENRKNLISLKAVLEKNGRDFFLNEGTIKPSKKEEAHINETFDGIDSNDEAPIYEPIEDYDDQYNYDTLEVMQANALKRAEACQPFGQQIMVSDIENRSGVRYFTIINKNNSNNQSYAVYEIDNKLFYREIETFIAILTDIESNIVDITALEKDYSDPLIDIDYIEFNDYKAAKDLISTLFSCMGISNNILAENIIVKRPSLGSDGDVEKSKLYDDILNGDAEQRKFEKEVEDDTQKAGIENPLAPSQPQQAESVQILPNAHRSLVESTSINEKKEENMEIIYEPMDWVIIKENGMKAQVNDVVTDDEGNVTMLTILASNGVLYDVEDFSEIMPDPLYLENIPGRVINSQNLTVPTRAEFDLDMKTRMPKPVKNEEIDKDLHDDLNGKKVMVYVLANGMRLNAEPYLADVKDIKESKNMIHVVNECGEVEEYDVKKNIEFVEKPYAVVVDSEGKPVRSIKIDPTSYIEAAEDELVVCEVEGKETKFPKKLINVIS